MASVFTNIGQERTIDHLDSTNPPANYFIAWGTGVGTAAVGDTTLFTEASESRTTATKSQPAANTLRWVGTITASAGKTITNAGVFDASTVGNMYVKGDFTGIVLNNGDSIQFTIELLMKDVSE